MAAGPDEYVCGSCSATFKRNRFGYFQIMREIVADAGTSQDYAAGQHRFSSNAVKFLDPLLRQEPCRTVLDVGCGVGATITALARLGYEAYGVDLPEQSQHWAAVKNDRERLFAASALQLPFADNSFDFVYSLGVIEHIGTVIGHCTLRDDCVVLRRQYAGEILRVTRPGGRILIACPNKTFPVDLQHGSDDAVRKANPLRSFISARTGINIHKTWGRYHLVSYAELKDLFVPRNGPAGRELTAIPLRNYFEFARLKQGILRPLGGVAEYWVNNMPAPARATFLNPYVMAQIRKEPAATTESAAQAAKLSDKQVSFTRS
ncbi:MAG TPA: class I SAM-dependent methyltransferase [Terriglobales bacterium]|nr:class I SAM-dependent methyltransferase [Terriglobales bacterium]